MPGFFLYGDLTTTMQFVNDSSMLAMAYEKIKTTATVRFVHYSRAAIVAEWSCDDDEERT